MKPNLRRERRAAHENAHGGFSSIAACFRETAGDEEAWHRWWCLFPEYSFRFKNRLKMADFWGFQGEFVCGDAQDIIVEGDAYWQVAQLDVKKGVLAH